MEENRNAGCTSPMNTITARHHFSFSPTCCCCWKNERWQGEEGRGGGRVGGWMDGWADGKTLAKTIYGFYWLCLSWRALLLSRRFGLDVQLCTLLVYAVPSSSSSSAPFLSSFSFFFSPFLLFPFGMWMRRREPCQPSGSSESICDRKLAPVCETAAGLDSSNQPLTPSVTDRRKKKNRIKKELRNTKRFA